MNDKVYSIDEIREIVVPIMKKYEIKKAYIFGSYARGEATKDSDIDLLVEGGNMETLFDVLDFQSEIEGCIEKKADIVDLETYNHNKVDKSYRWFSEGVESEAILLYG